MNLITKCSAQILLVVIIAFLISDYAIAKSTNKFVVGQVITNSQTLRLSNAEIYRKTIGMPRKNAVLESGGDFAKYFKRRGERSVGGKAFEAKTAIRLNQFFAKNNIDDRLLITAVEGLPGDASDLIRINGAGEVIEKYQLKLEYKSAMSALNDSRYIDNTIVTPPNVLKEIKRNLKKEKGKNIGKGKLLSPEWAEIEQAIADGRLTDRIGEKTVPTTKSTINAGKGVTHKLYDLALKRLGLPLERIYLCYLHISFLYPACLK